MRNFKNSHSNHDPSLPRVNAGLLLGVKKKHFTLLIVNNSKTSTRIKLKIEHGKVDEY